MFDQFTALGENGGSTGRFNTFLNELSGKLDAENQVPQDEGLFSCKRGDENIRLSWKFDAENPVPQDEGLFSCKKGDDNGGNDGAGYETE